MSATAAPPVLLEVALSYLEHGVPLFPVFPIRGGWCACDDRECKSPGKHPLRELAPHGLLDASTDPVVVSAWWTRTPDANIATPTTWAHVLDIDPRHGGNATLAALEGEHGALPHGPRVLTGGGGVHLYFAPVPGLRNSSGVVGAGLDVRAEGGYVLLPPSGHVSGGGYREDPDRPLFETPLPVMPDQLVRLAMRQMMNAAANGTAPARSSDDWGALLAGAPKGQRREVALRCAGHYLGLRIAADEVVTILSGYAARCVPPLPEREVRELVRDLARRDRQKDRQPAVSPSVSTPEEDGLGLVSLGELLDEPDEVRAFVVADRLPTAGLGMLAGKPKAGKSTLARCLALAVSRGAPWLGHATLAGPVIYLALEEKRAEVRAHFKALGATAADPVLILCASAPLDALARLRREAERLRPVLIVIDPLFRLIRVDDGNDYAQMTAALEPLMVLARETGAHVLLVHHLGKGERSGADAILGSTAILGAVDTAFLMRRGEKHRTLESVQRYGRDLEEITVTLDPITRNVEAGPLKADAEQAEAAKLIVGYLSGGSAPVTEAEIDDAIECRTQLRRGTLRALVAAGTVCRSGRGGKADPYRYVLGNKNAGEALQ